MQTEQEILFRDFDIERAELELRLAFPKSERVIKRLEKARRITPEMMELFITI